MGMMAFRWTKRNSVPGATSPLFFDLENRTYKVFTPSDGGLAELRTRIMA